MEDYPRNLVEFGERFATEEACISYLISLRWPNGFGCRSVVGTGHGGEPVWRWSVLDVATRPRSQPAPGSRRPTNHCEYGSRPWGWSPARRRGPAPSDCSEFWGWAAMRRLGC